MMDKNTIVFDLETTGVNPNKDEILQVSIIDGDSNTLMNTYVRPERHTSWPQAEAVNNISPAMVRKAPTLPELRGQIQEIFDNAELCIGYNQEFDIRFLRAAGINIDDRLPQRDVMRDFAPIFGQYDSFHHDFKWQKLTTCAEYYGYEFKAHDALEDVRATLHCYKKMNESHLSELFEPLPEEKPPATDGLTLDGEGGHERAAADALGNASKQGAGMGMRMQG